MKNFLKTYNELLSIPIAIVLFFFAPPLYRLIDPGAGQFDAGYFQVLIFAIVAFNVASGVAWLMFRLNFPSLYKYWDNDFEDDVLERPWPVKQDGGHKAQIYSIAIYSLYFLTLIILIISLL
jgi:hypothetical protein